MSARAVAYRAWAALDRHIVGPILERRLQQIFAETGIAPEAAIEEMCADAEAYIRENAREAGPT